MPDIALVCMPLVAVERPSLALSLLKPLLVEADLTTRIVNAHLHYLDCIGPGDYRLLGMGGPQDLLAEWVFAEEAFGEGPAAPEAFAEALLAGNQRFAQQLGREGMLALLRRLRGSAGLFLDWMAEITMALEPRIVGCTSTFQQHVASLALLRRLKQRRPDLVTVMGGANLETVMGRATHERFPWVDVVVSGEADDIVAPLFRDLLEHGAAIPAGKAPFGVLVPAHRRVGYPTVAGGDGLPRRSVASLQGLPAPDYGDYFEDLGRSLHRAWIEPGLPVELSRGCWWGERSHCTFCGLNGGTMTYRARSPEEAEALFHDLSARHAVRAFEVVDNILAMSYFDTLLARDSFIEAGYRLFFETKSNLREAHIAALARAGVVSIQPGIESLHSAVLRLMGKGVTAMANIRLLRLCGQYGIRAGWSVIAGFPGEQDAWHAETAAIIPRISHLQPGAIVRLRYDRFSPYFARADSFGLALRPMPAYAQVYPERGPALADHAYYFCNEGEPQGGRSILRTPQSDQPGLEGLRQAILAWQEAWQDPVPPRLMLTTDAEGGLIEDTRPGFAAAPYRIGPDAVALLRTAAEGATSRQLAAACGEAEFEALIAVLEARGLVILLDGYVLSLPLWHPAAPLVTEGPLPTGRFRPPPLPQGAPAA